MEKKKIHTMMAASLLLAVAALTSCVKDELHDTPHPGHGKVSVTADWTQRGEGVDIPASWNIALGDYTGNETGATHAPEQLFEPGSYTLVAHSPAEGITVNGTTATAAAASGNREGVGGFITNALGWLFTHVQEVAIEADTDHEFTVAMHQQVRELTLVIEPKGDAAGRIEAIEGYLSGAAGTLDFATDTHGTPSNVELRFTKITSGDDAGKWTATVRLLGIAGDTQRLTATLTYTDGNPRPTHLESDLTEALAGFNGGKTQPLVLGGTTTDTPAEADVTATIDNWNTITGDPVEAM